MSAPQLLRAPAARACTPCTHGCASSHACVACACTARAGGRQVLARPRGEAAAPTIPCLPPLPTIPWSSPLPIFPRDLQVRIPRAEVSAIVEAVRDALHAALRARGVPDHDVADAADALGAGSYRRGKPSSGDCDVLICRKDGRADAELITDVLRELGKQARACAWHGMDVVHVCM